MSERVGGEIHFFDWHAAVVVFGGIIGSLLIALRGGVFLNMLKDWFTIIVGQDLRHRQITEIKADISKMEKAWADGRRSEVLALLESSASIEVRVAAESLVSHAQGHRLAERFEYLRSVAQEELLPQIEGWDMVARLGPSFGIVGTVTGMIQLFKNMATQSGNLGGAMALALLATLYGILIGTALGGPMSTRMNQLLSERLGVIDLLERQVSALVEEDRTRRTVGDSSL